MNISEDQRQTLDLMAESAGWNWADVEQLSQEMFGECVAGLSNVQATRMQDVVANWQHADGEVAHDCDTEYRLDCARCNGVSPMDAGCW